MKAIVIALFLSCGLAAAEAPLTVVIHDGAGVSSKDLTHEQATAREQVLEQAVRTGFKVLQDGGASLDSVQAAIIVLEDSPFFNAGRGSVFNAQGAVEIDASIMDGATTRAGAVAGVTGVRNPIGFARLVMDRTKRVLLMGHGAEEFARECQVRFEDPAWFITPEQQTKLKKAQARAALNQLPDDLTMRLGTVGAVALNKAGHLAADTSTGDQTNTRRGRIGDSPILGAGTYAEDGVCAVSGTGTGEYFIRSVVAHEVASLMKYRGDDLKTAADDVIHQQLKKLGGDGGIIAIDSKGNVATPFNTPGMYRAWMKADGTLHVAIFEE